MHDLKARDISRGLLATWVKWAVTLEDDQMDLVRRPISQLLEQGDLDEHLFTALAADEEARCDVYGYGSQDLDTDFEELRAELIRLSQTGRCDLDVIADGEEILQRLIKGLLAVEWESKGDVNPRIAEETAKIFRAMKEGRPPDDPTTPNEIDAMQADAVFVHQANRCCREALQEILVAVRQINRSSERGNPGPSR